MFTQNFKFTKKSAAIAVISAAALMIAAVFVCAFPCSGFGLSEIIDVSDTEGRLRYLAEFSWEADPESELLQSIVLPNEFSEILSDYNELQLKQGFDLSDYRGKECAQYTYTVLNYPNYSGRVYATLYIRSGRVIAADIHSAELNGFIHGIK